MSHQYRKLEKQWSKHWFQFILNNSNKPWDWDYLSENPNITWEIIQANPDKPWDWGFISGNPNITWKIIQFNFRINLGIGVCYLKIQI